MEHTAAAIVAASVVGVLAVLLTLLALLEKAESRFVTRREYDATLQTLQKDVKDIKTKLDGQG